MKILNRMFLTVVMMTALLPALQSCDDNEGYSLGDFTPPLWATVRTDGGAFYLDCDVWGTLWPVNIDLGGYKPVDGQRVITVFNPLSDQYGEYDHAVKILSLRDVLTKKVEELTAENEEEYGNDPLFIYKGDLSVSGNHLNVVFLQNLPKTTKHRISLVQSAEDIEAATDGYVHLQLRYNNYDDLSGVRAYGAVSFSLESLNIPSDTKGIKLKLNSEVNGEVEVTFNNNTTPDDSSEQKLSDIGNEESGLR